MATSKESIFKELSKTIIDGDTEKSVKLSQKGVAMNIDPYDLIQLGLMKGMNVVGDLFKNKEYYLPEVLLAAEAMHASMDILKPLVRRDVQGAGVVVIATVEGDIHDIGKNIVATMLESVGFTVIDLGVDVGPKGFLEAAEKNKPDIIALSALMTTTMENMVSIICELKKAGCKAKIIVGGAPLNEDIAAEYGADGYAQDALAVQRLASGIVKKSK
jgi:5-methyltetrahydrofolate--homocysteine methyltransferase